MATAYQKLASDLDTGAAQETNIHHFVAGFFDTPFFCKFGGTMPNLLAVFGLR